MENNIVADIVGTRSVHTPLSKFTQTVENLASMKGKYSHDEFEGECREALESYMREITRISSPMKEKLTIEKDFMRLLEENNLEELSRLLDEDGTDKIDGYNLSDLACKAVNLPVLNLLHEKNRKFTVYTMEEAIRARNLDIVKFLCKYRRETIGDINIMEFASRIGCLDIVKFLYETFPENHWNINYALSGASSNGHYEIVKFFYESFHVSNWNATDLLSRAFKHDHYEIMRYIVDKELDKVSQKKEKLTIEKDFRRLLEENNLDELSRLLDEDKTDKINGEYLSRFACNAGNLPVLKLLYERNRKFHDRIVYAAILGDFLEIVKFLLENKICEFNKELLDYSIKNHRFKIAKYLLGKI